VLLDDKFAEMGRCVAETVLMVTQHEAYLHWTL